MHESIIFFLVRKRCRRKESSRSLSHLLMSFLLCSLKELTFPSKLWNTYSLFPPESCTVSVEFFYTHLILLLLFLSDHTFSKSKTIFCRSARTPLETTIWLLLYIRLFVTKTAYIRQAKNLNFSLLLVTDETENNRHAQLMQVIQNEPKVRNPITFFVTQ